MLLASRSTIQVSMSEEMSMAVLPPAGLPSGSSQDGDLSHLQQSTKRSSMECTSLLLPIETKFRDRIQNDDARLRTIDLSVAGPRGASPSLAGSGEPRERQDALRNPRRRSMPIDRHVR